MEWEKIRKGIKENWQTEEITKFLPKGFFVVIFGSKDIRDRILQEGLWMMDGPPLYIQKWHVNFISASLCPYERPIWIRIYNLPIKFWAEESLEKMRRSLGTLMEIHVDIVNGDSYLYARMQLDKVSKIPSKIKLRAKHNFLIQEVEIKEERLFYCRCSSMDHNTSNRRLPTKKVENWIPETHVTLANPGEKNDGRLLSIKGAPEAEDSIPIILNTLSQPIEESSPIWTMPTEETNKEVVSSNGEWHSDSNNSNDDELDILDRRCLSQSASKLLGITKFGGG
ncbi:hypothetical protein SUGI_0454660 [Cryptomeria japonica]|nr:hypothetical protein SUGI_0454660 [Cryptomeria japonica]